MATLGEKALELIRESIRSHEMLGPFNEEKVRSVLEEIRTLYSEVKPRYHKIHEFLINTYNF